ncbi:MAG: hypothetical protein V4706_02705 [Pseudomonadota bacterium]
MHTQQPPTHQHKPRLCFALAGQLVSKPSHARRLLDEAIKAERQWQIPQAQSVLRQLLEQPS